MISANAAISGEIFVEVKCFMQLRRPYLRPWAAGFPPSTDQFFLEFPHITTIIIHKQLDEMTAKDTADKILGQTWEMKGNSNKNNNNTTKETIITMEDFNTTTPSS